MLKQYCTKELLDSLDALDSDSDPFIKAQDFDSEWLDLVKIQKDLIADDLFIVSYHVPSIDFGATIHLWVKNDSGKIVITKVR